MYSLNNSIYEVDTLRLISETSKKPAPLLPLNNKYKILLISQSPGRAVVYAFLCRFS